MLDAGLVGGIIGGLVGVAGGIYGTFRSIQSTKGPLERAFMVKASVIAWVAIVVFIGLMFVLPNPYRHLLWIPYGVLLPLGIVKLNKRVGEIRKVEDAS
jgi:hypothetical protein